jgi:hypothetical protein
LRRKHLHGDAKLSTTRHFNKYIIPHNLPNVSLNSVPTSIGKGLIIEGRTERDIEKKKQTGE